MSDRPQTFEEWFAENCPHFSAMSPLRYSPRESAEKAWHAALDAAFAQVEKSQQRQMDLIRYARHFLHDEGCISDEEYAAFVQDNEGGERKARLESYDEVRARLTQVEKERDQLAAQLQIIEAAAKGKKPLTDENDPRWSPAYLDVVELCEQRDQARQDRDKFSGQAAWLIPTGYILIKQDVEEDYRGQ